MQELKIIDCKYCLLLSTHKTKNIIQLQSLEEFSKYKNKKPAKIVCFDICSQATYYKLIKANVRFVYLKNIKFINLKILKDVKHVLLFVISLKYIINMIYFCESRKIKYYRELYLKISRFNEICILNDTFQKYSHTEIQMFFAILDITCPVYENLNLFLGQYVEQEI